MRRKFSVNVNYYNKDELQQLVNDGVIVYKRLHYYMYTSKEDRKKWVADEDGYMSLFIVTEFGAEVAVRY